MRHSFKKPLLWMRALAVASLLLFNIQVVGVSVTSNAPISALTAGEKHTCAIRAGTLLCWGENGFGQLGLGDRDHRAAPQAVTAWPAAASGAVTAVSAGRSYTCAVRNGALYCWGANEYGQLGLGKPAAGESLFGMSALEPRAVTLPGRGAVTAIATGWRHTCAVRGGALYCWGEETFGQLGSDEQVEGTGFRVVKLPGSSAVTSLIAGWSHTCAARGGALYCWGDNFYGQLGLGNTNWHEGVKAIVLPGSGAVTAVAAGESHTCAARGNALYCWGRNDRGQLGTGSTTRYTTPQGISLPGEGSVTALATGAEGHTCAVRGGALYCWGRNDFGQIGLARPLTPQPVKLP